MDHGSQTSPSTCMRISLPTCLSWSGRCDSGDRESTMTLIFVPGTGCVVRKGGVSARVAGSSRQPGSEPAAALTPGADAT